MRQARTLRGAALPATPPPDLSRLRIPRDEPSAGQRGALKWVLVLAGLTAVLLPGAWFYLKSRGATEVTLARVEVSGGAGGHRLRAGQLRQHLHPGPR